MVQRSELKVILAQQWLPKESMTSTARIFSLGYNAAFQGRSNILTVSDFAKDMLFDMKFAIGYGESHLDISHLPIIFVAHSMGRVVVKKALMLGHND